MQSKPLTQIYNYHFNIYLLAFSVLSAISKYSIAK